MIGGPSESSGNSNGSALDEEAGIVGENGTQTNSTTTGQNGKTERIDIENPNPGVRDGNIHYHDSNNVKYYYDINSNSFIDAPPYIQRMLNEPWVIKAIEKAVKYLGY